MDHKNILVNQVPILPSEVSYLIDLVQDDLARKRITLDRATIPQRQVELRGEMQEIEGLRERLRFAK